MAISSRESRIPCLPGVKLLLNRPLPLDKPVHLIFRHRSGELLADSIVFIQQVDRLLHPFLDDLPHVLRLIQPRFLFEKPDGVTRRKDRLSVEFLVHPRQNPQRELLPEP